MDDEERTVPVSGFLPRVLDDMSVSEMEAYLADLEEEISRVREVVRKRSGHLSAAEELFRKARETGGG
ncbi:DUF1192 domain-containing protein [Phaeovibrio sulfidiphilus]|uniref:DUF1192 domain-containing protein n=1 Tax=Phaeovibrio sulfidiphilus TaxID=1220600 RepID=A0A8J7CD72_9PROT|nr:DUF1192 domain-containing protein [Phaeovibrio sulfidiphilus]MBE1236799.1 DUF1192 domain-containing protein [Phaeovibrio sulfidiphilus]